MSTNRTKCLCAICFLSLAGCSTGVCSTRASEDLTKDVVYATARIPVHRLKIKVIDSPDKTIASNPILFASLKNNALSDQTDKTRKQNIIQPFPETRYLAKTNYYGNARSLLNLENYCPIIKIAQPVVARNAFISVLGYAASRTKNTDITVYNLSHYNIYLSSDQHNIET